MSESAIDQRIPAAGRLDREAPADEMPAGEREAAEATEAAEAVPSREQPSAEAARPVDAARARAKRPAEAKGLLPAPLPARRVPPPVEQPAEPIVRTAELAALPPVPVLPALPRRRRGRFGTPLAFLFFVVLPTALFGVYMYHFAPNEFTSEFRFSVSQGNPVLPGSSSTTITSPAASGGALSSLVSALGAGGNTASPQNFIVTDYLTSRQAVVDLEGAIDLRAMYTKPSIPWWNRFDPKGSNEAFIKYFQSYIYANYDQVTGLAVARVRAFSAADTALIATTLSNLSEKLVNDLNSRANTDAIRFAQTEVGKMETDLTRINTQLLAYRNKEGTINPNNAAVPINILLVQNLESNLSTLQTQVDATLRQGVSASAPVVKSMRMQIDSVKQQLKSVADQVARDSDRSRALAKVVGSYEDLVFNQQYLQSMVVQVRQALVLAKAYAAAQHLYIVPYVSPTRPESSDYPNRPLSILLAGLSFFGLWFGGLMLIKSIRDHSY